MDRLAGKVAIVTGAGSGVGWAVTRLFASEGARVVCADMSGSEFEAAEMIGAAAVPVHVDMTSGRDVERMINTALRRCGALDLLFNNVGFGGPRVALAETDEALFDKIVAVNLKGVFLGMKYAIPVMLRAGRGSIVNTASVSGLMAGKRLASYAAVEAAVVQMTKSAALEYAGSGVRINVICSAMSYAELAEAHRDLEVPSGAHPPTPLGRCGLSQELAATAVFLASDESSFVTGAAFPVDGGHADSGPMPVRG